MEISWSACTMGTLGDFKIGEEAHINIYMTKEFKKKLIEEMPLTDKPSWMELRQKTEDALDAFKDLLIEEKESD